MSFLKSKSYLPDGKAGSLKALRGGFTLVELLVVIAIISLLSSIVLTSVGQAREKAKIAKVKEELNSIRTAMYLFLQNHTELPPTDDGPDNTNNCSACLGLTPPYDCANNSGSLTHGWATNGVNGVMDELKPYLSSPINVDPWGHSFCYDDNYGDRSSIGGGLFQCSVVPTTLWSMGPTGHSNTYQEPLTNGGFLGDDIGIYIYDPACS